MITIEEKKYLKTSVGNQWWDKIGVEFEKEYMHKLSSFIKSQRKKFTIYPESKDIFNALTLTPFNKVRVVILGQCPYHNGNADGLAFSCNNEYTPPSLRNIFKEVNDDIYNGEKLKQDPNLKRWAKQGVLLLNTSLTVEESKPLSHKGLGWGNFIEEIIKMLNRYSNSGLVFLLWGGNAIKFEKYIDVGTHYVFKAAHPSPYSANKFFGCKHFSKVNKIFKENDSKEIRW